MKYPLTVIIRHRKENLKKCSLRGLEQREDMQFLSYPHTPIPKLDKYILLTLDAPPLQKEDSDHGLLIIDATWRYAEKMHTVLKEPLKNIESRSLPAALTTAYPRKQTDCHDPARGLASIEAIYAAYRLLGRDTQGLLDNYYWKEGFIAQNSHYI